MRKGQKKPPISEETREKMRLAQRKRMEEGRHNFHKGHALYGKGIGDWSSKNPSPRKGIKVSPESVEKMRKSLRPRWDSAEFKEQARQRMLGVKPTLATVEKRRQSRAGYRHSDETRRKIAASQKQGANHPLWKGGKRSPNELFRKSVEYKIWRDAVYRRDDFTCQECGKRGGKLNADHIKPFALFPDLRLAIDNGRTLCLKCHRATETYGGKILRFRKTA